MAALVVTTENRMRIVPYEAPDYKLIREPYCMMVNEEGQLQDLPLNPLGCYLYGTLIHGHPIVGDIMVLKLGYHAGEPDAVSMNDEEAQLLGEQFRQLSGGIVHWTEKEGENR